MSFDSLFQIEPAPTRRGNPAGVPPRPRKTTQQKTVERGCEHCTLNRPELTKIFGKVEGKPLALFAQCPGPDENEEGKELVGRAGRWWWTELKRVGLTRIMFDIQNVVRCFTADVIEGSYDTELKMRNPTKHEITCCSIYTEQALEKLKARQILIFGQIAAKALLGNRLPSQKIFFSEKLKAKVYLVDHPSYFIRGYASADRVASFRKILDQFAADAKDEEKDLSDSFAFIKAQDYRLVKCLDSAQKAARIIRKYAKKKRRISVDIESADFGNGHEAFACGFCPRPGLSFVFVWKHKELLREHPEVLAVAKELLEDPKIEKGFQYGCSDVLTLLDKHQIKVAGFTHDTLLSEYLRFPDVKSYGLDNTAERRFPEFSGYKLLTVLDLMEGLTNVPAATMRGTLSEKAKYLETTRQANFSKLSLETLRLYNGADCDLGKRIEISNKKHVPQNLLQLYIDLSFVLYRMEPNGPWFDYEQNEKLHKLLPWKQETKLQQLRKILGREEYNPGSPKQVHDALYEDLGLEYPFDDKPNTRKKTLLLLARDHEFPKVQVEWRTVSKGHSTYVVSYRTCADANEGRLRTKWWATGTRTGRLSSGGDRGKVKDKINLQNVHGDSQIRNQCVADPRWKKAYKAIARILESFPTVTAYWLALDTWEAVCAKAKKKKQSEPAKPEMDVSVKAHFAHAEIKIENWIKKHCPDLKTFLILDYGQVEVRVFAQLSGDENLKADCQSSDIHTVVGVTMTGWPAEKIAHDRRTRTLTKNVHFAVLFGIARKNVYDYVLAMTDPEEQETISREEVERAFDRYFKRYTKAKPYQESQRAFGREHKYVETLFGMRQPLNVRDENEEEDDEGYDDEKRGAYWGNQAINGPVQGTAHQILECGLINIYRKPEKYAVISVPCMDVHDALYFIVNVLELREAYKKARYLMEKESLATMKQDFPNIEWDVPIITEGEAGLSLGCKVDIDDKLEVGDFMLSWYRERRKQNIALAKELKQVDAA